VVRPPSRYLSVLTASQLRQHTGIFEHGVAADHFLAADDVAELAALKSETPLVMPTSASAGVLK
jgi:hypothetical protein